MARTIDLERTVLITATIQFDHSDLLVLQKVLTERLAVNMSDPERQRVVDLLETIERNLKE